MAAWVKNFQEPTVVFKKLESGGDKSAVSLLSEYAQKSVLPKPKLIPVVDYYDQEGDMRDYYYKIKDNAFPKVSARNKACGKQLAARSAIDQLIADGLLVVRDGRLTETDVTTTVHQMETLYIDLYTDVYRQYLSDMANNFLKDHNFISVSEIETPTVFACIIEVNKKTRQPSVVSWAAGNKCIDTQSIKNDGSALFDCHAEVLARRGWMRFIYNELATNPSTRFTVKGQEYKLRDHFSYHLFVSKAPCGDAHIFDLQTTEATLANDETSWENPRLKHRPTLARETESLLRIKLENGAGTLPTDTDADPSKLRTMSCSDKILKWNVLGIQGSLLSQIIEPIFLKSIHIGGGFHHGHLARALCCRAQKLKQSTVTHPVLAKYSCQPKAGSDSFAFTWNMVDKTFETINPRKGMLDSGGMSKLCKRQFYVAFLGLVTKRTYSQAKARSVQYKGAQIEFETGCRDAGYRCWIHKRATMNNF